MTPLRQRMLDALVLRGMAARTQEAYIGAVAGLARHYRRSPDTLSADEVQHYLLHLLRERRLSRSSVNQYGCACRFLYGTVLGLDGAAFQIPLAPAPQRLPEILSREELARLFAMATHLKSRIFLMLTYGTGLRLSELCRLRAQHIDSHADRMCIRVEQGKGGKDRYVPLSEDVLHLLEAGYDLYSLQQWPGHNHVSTTTRYLHLRRPDVPDGARSQPLALLSALPRSRHTEPRWQPRWPRCCGTSGQAICARMA